jgi:hypothetical protein
VGEQVSFYAPNKVATAAADAWPWQTWFSWLLRSLITIVLAVAGVVSSVYVFRWTLEWTDWSFALVLTAFLIGLMPARHYFARTHPELGKWACGMWAVVLAFALIIAAVTVTPREKITPESPAGIEHEIELFNARNYPPRYQVEVMRSRAIDYCPDYEKWWVYLFPLRACWDARKFEGWLAEIDRYKANDRKLIAWGRHPPRAPTASLWPGWAYIGHEAHMLPMRLLLVLIAAVAFWGAVEMQNVILAEKPGSLTPSTSTSTAAPIAAKSQTEQAFEAWASEMLVKDTATDTPTGLLFLAYRLACLAKGWPEYNSEAFGRKLASWARDKFKTVEREGAKKVPVFVGIALVENDITTQARRSYENTA